MRTQAPISRRTKKVASELQLELSKILLEDISDPRLKNITFSDIKVSADLRYARVYYMHSLDEKADKEIKKGFTKATPFFRRKIAEDLKMRNVPDLVFEKDQQIETINRLYNVFADINK